jgi:hypothetical protein
MIFGRRIATRTQQVVLDLGANIAECICDGEYLLRLEHITLEFAGTVGKVQYRLSSVDRPISTDARKNP